VRVLHAPVNVGNQPWALSRAERALGCRSELTVNYDTRFGYRHDRCLSPLGRGSWRDRAVRLAYGLSAPLRFDVLHYYFGRSLLCWDDYGPRNRLWFKDLRLARQLGRRVVMTLQGCDVRLAHASEVRNEVTPCREGECEAYARCVSTYDQGRQFLIDEVLPLVDRTFFLNPELGHYLPNGSFLPYASVDVQAIRPVPPRRSGTIRVVHAPSDPSTKGTRYILAAMDELRRHYPMELTLIQGMTHEAAMAAYAHADLVVDQVLYGWYGGLAVETMALGKPTACYLRQADATFVPSAMLKDLPVYDVRPTNLIEDLASVLERRGEWQERSLASRHYVERWHDPVTIARAMLECYRSPDARFSVWD
jgi:hypothetical protein